VAQHFDPLHYGGGTSGGGGAYDTWTRSRFTAVRRADFILSASTLSIALRSMANLMWELTQSLLILSSDPTLIILNCL